MSGCKVVQGQGAGTEYKERRLGAVFKINLCISKSPKLKDHPYFHFDLYAGSGYNELADCKGSPIAFIDAVKCSGRTNFYAHFVEQDKISCGQLYRRISRHEFWSRCSVHPGNNDSFIEAIPDLIRYRNQNPKKTIGSVLIDPNGHNVHWEKLEWLSTQCPKLDIVINYNTSIVKRITGIEAKGSAGWYRGQLIRLEEVPRLLNKKHVQISTPVPPNSKNKFVVLICRNFRTGDHPNMGFYHWDSKEGERIRVQEGLTKKERSGQEPLL